MTLSVNPDELSAMTAELDSLAPAGLPGSRRGFLQASAVGGFAAMVAPVGSLQAQVITTDTVGLEAGIVTLPAQNGPIEAYYAKPAKGKGLATIVVVQEIFGLHEHIRDVCRRFAKQGYLAIAPAFFQRQGDPSLYKTVPELFSNIVSKVPDGQVLSDVDAALDWSERHGGVAGRAGITGFCWGGRIVWLAAASSKRLKAGVAWYGRLQSPVTENNPRHPMDIARQLQAPVLGLYGSADSGIPNEDVAEMRVQLAAGTAASKASNLVLYTGAPHAFHADYRPSYRPAEAADAWQKCLAWFKTHLPTT